QVPLVLEGGEVGVDGRARREADGFPDLTNARGVPAPAYLPVDELEHLALAFGEIRHGVDGTTITCSGQTSVRGDRRRPRVVTPTLVGGPDRSAPCATDLVYWRRARRRVRGRPADRDGHVPVHRPRALHAAVGGTARGDEDRPRAPRRAPRRRGG